jgi:RecB family exonuclease
MYRTCPRQYEFGCVKKIPKGHISAGESFGISMHSTLQKWGNAELGSAHSGVPKEDQITMFETPSAVEQRELNIDLLHEYWYSSFVVEGYETRVEADMARNRGAEILRYYFDWWQQQDLSVLAVEKGFRLDLEGMELSGRFDRVEMVEGGVKVIDFKTSAVRTQDQVDADLQLSVYAMACEKVFDLPCKELCFLFLREDGVTEVLTKRNDSQLSDSKKQILFVDKAIESKDFRPTPSKRTCNWCPYRNVCDMAS